MNPRSASRGVVQYKRRCVAGGGEGVWFIVWYGGCRVSSREEKSGAGGVVNAGLAS